MKKNIKRIVCLLFAVVFMFGTAFVSSAEEEYLTSFKVSGTNSMTLTFGTSSGQTISVDLGAVLLMPDEEEGNIAAFISNDPDFGTVYVSYTVRVNSKKQNVYKFYLGELASNEIVETPFIKACDMAYLYLSLWVNYDAKGSDFTTVGFDGLMTTANVNNIVVFLMPVLYSHEYASSETLPVLPSVPGYKGVKISAAHKVVSEYFTMTEKQLKKSGCYDSFYVSQGLLLFHGDASSPRHATGARFPSVNRRISPTRYSSGSLLSLYPPPLPCIPSTNLFFISTGIILSRYFSEIPCLSATSFIGIYPLPRCSARSVKTRRA